VEAGKIRGIAGVLIWTEAGRFDAMARGATRRKVVERTLRPMLEAVVVGIVPRISRPRQAARGGLRTRAG
jgi:hypothetical protein